MGAILVQHHDRSEFEALSEVWQKQKRWERKHKAAAPKRRDCSSGRGGGFMRARAYMQTSSDMDGLSESLRRDAEELNDTASVCSEASFCSDVSSQFECEIDGERRLIVSSSASSCSSASCFSTRSRRSALPPISEYCATPASPASCYEDTLEDYAAGLRPLLVTRGELLKFFLRMPADVLAGPQPLGAPAAHLAHRELLEALCSSIACLAKVSKMPQSQVLCLCEGFEYGPESYSISGEVCTRLLIVARPLEGLGTAHTGANQEPRSALPIKMKLTDVTSRAPFLAELLAMRKELQQGMQQQLSGESALKRRRRTLKHVADALKALKRSGGGKR